ARRVLDAADTQTGHKRLAQIRNATCVYRLSACRLVLDRGDENDGDARTGCLQAALQIDPGHATQMDVQDEAGRLTCPVAIEKCLGRGKSLGTKAVRCQQPTNCFKHVRVVIDDRDNLWGDAMNPRTSRLSAPFDRER